MKKMIALGLVGILSVFGIGCGGSNCESACEDFNECPGIPLKIDDCAASCEKQMADAEAKGCTAEYDAVDDCSSDVDDVCTDTTTCKSQSEALATCLSKM